MKKVRIEELILKHDAMPSLDTLVSEGCDPVLILSVLQALRSQWPHVDDWKKLTGMTLDQTKRLIDRMRRTADQVQQTHSHALGFLLVQSDSTKSLPQLPNSLRRYAQQLESATKLFGPRKQAISNAWKCHLVSHVLNATANFHDKEVSELISAALNGQTYTAHAHKVWREQKFHREAKHPESSKFNSFQQGACNRFNTNQLETTEFNKFQ